MSKLGNNRKRTVGLFVLTGISLLVLAFAGQLYAADAQPTEIKTDSGVEMVQIPAGEFLMGSDKGEIDVKPAHKVYLDSFYMDKYPVTQAEFENLVGENPAKWKNPKNPVEQVRWSDAVKYCNMRSYAEGFEPCYDLKTWQCNFNANGYRLPTEAEWEYAARAGTRTKYFFGDDVNKLKYFAWFKDNSGLQPRPVGDRKANPWGLHDMYGNVWHWCNDFYQVDYYRSSPEKNPQGPESGETRVLRGGSWDSIAGKLESAYRYNENPGYADACFGYDIYGFRCVRSVPVSAFQEIKAEKTK